MLICRFISLEEPATPHYGRVTDAGVQPLRLLPPPETPVAAWLHERAEASEIWANETVQLEAVRLLPPCEPSKIVCVGRNYRAHAEELGNAMPSEPLLFLKPTTALIGPGETVYLPPASAQVEHEGEIAVVIGRTATRLGDDANPLDYVLGYTCLNDVTARDIQRRDVQFTRGKSYDTFCPVGPYLATGLDFATLSVALRVNGVPKQYGQASQMAFDIPFLVRYISHAMTLRPGDIIATGTPAGVGPLRSGDEVEIEVNGVGVLRHYVEALPSAAT